MYQEKVKTNKNIMPTHLRGFTLIELLVVVLIIGILSAIAIPQYQKAVFKTKLVAVMPMLKAVKEAEERYYMANGNYTSDINNLDLGMDKTVWWEGGHDWKQTFINLEWAHINVIRGGYGDNVTGCAFAYYLDKHPTRGGQVWCTEKNGNSVHPWCQKICEGMGYPYTQWAA